MGTVQQWLNVVLSGGFWAGCMLLFDVMRNDNFGQSGRARILSTIVAGFWFGLMVTFGWRNAVRAPLIYLVIPAFIASVFGGFFCRRTIRNRGNPSPSPG
jgi:hypothetical protein